MMKSTLLLFLIIFTLAVGCLTVEKSLAVKELPSQKREASEIEVRYNYPLNNNYTILGTLTVRYDSGYQRETLLHKLKSEAAKSGADGISILSLHNYKETWNLDSDSGPGYRRYDSKKKIMRASMYRYLSK